MIEAILWDNDGVLVDTEHLYFEATQHVLGSVGISLTPAQYIELFLVQGRGAWHLAEEQGVSEPDITRLRAERDARYARALSQPPRLVAGIPSVLEELHGDYIMGVVTSSQKDHFDLIHQSSGLRQYFDFVLTAGDYAHAKPDPEPYLRALDRTGVDRQACLAIEDSERGLESATRAGIRCVVVPNGLTRSSNFASAYRVLESVRDIPGVLRSLAPERSGSCFRCRPRRDSD